MSDTLSRRSFAQTVTTLSIGGLVMSNFPPSTLSARAFKLCLNPGTIGVSANQQTLLDMAIAHGFEAIISMPAELSQYSGAELQELLERMKEHNITWGSTNLPVDFRKDEHTFKEDIETLKLQIKAIQAAGATRMNTWIMPSHNTLTYSQNFARHKERLGQCADVLDDHGVRLGLEYVAPKTLMNRSRYPFMRTMAEARELIDAMGRPNVGLVLDAFHWYCAEDTRDDILGLENKDIVTVDLNDARADLSRDEQIDGTRELPLATGVIDLQPFLSALVEIGYDGPVRAEPFNQTLREMDDVEGVKATYKAMAAAFALVG